MKVATLTCTRGTERRKLVEFCLNQIDWQTRQPDERIVVNYPAMNGKDLTKRFREGVERARAMGIDFIVVAEDDDSLLPTHIENYSQYFDNYDFIGDPWTTYYRLDTRRWETEHHHGRASLFTTAFRVSALDNFAWPADDYVFLDMPLWRHARKFRCKFVKSGAIGIKGHGFGMVGGKGHRQKLRHDDANMDFLKKNVSEKHIEFYTELMKTL